MLLVEFLLGQDGLGALQLIAVVTAADVVALVVVFAVGARFAVLLSAIKYLRYSTRLAIIYAS